MKRLLACALALSLPLAAVALDAPRFDPARLSAEVRTLSSDAFQGRGPATPAEQKNIDYLVGELKAAGVQPGGDLVDGKRGWTQAVPLRRSRLVGTPEISVAFGDTRVPLQQGEQVAVRAPMDGSAALAVKGAPLVFVGYGVKAPERDWDDFKGIDLAGKIAIALVNDPDYETGKGDFGGKAMTYYGRWSYKFEEAARQGALGLLVVHETAPASYGWATVKNSNTNAMFDIVRAHPGEVHPRVEGWVQRDVAADLFRRAGLDFDAQKKRAQSRDFRPVVLEGAAFSVSCDVDAGTITSHNVVGRIEGSKRPEETVIYSAHWDHLGVGAPDAKGDTIYNGAVDNATGIAALIEMGRAFAQAPRPDRSVVLLAVTAEEKGLLGSEYYAANPLYPLATTVAVINMDALDPGGRARNFTTSGSAKSGLLELLVSEGRKAGLAYAEDPHPEAGHFFRSDHFPFAKRGVPSVSFGSGNDLLEGGVTAGEAEGKAYTRDRYHQPADEWQASWTFAGMAHDLGLLYAVGRHLATSDEWPDWGTDSEFRAIRDRSASQRH